MADFQTRAQLLGALTGTDGMERHVGRQLKRLHRRAFFFNGSAGTGTGIVLIIAGILAIAFIAYSIWLRRKKQRELNAAGANRDDQLSHQQVQVPMQQPSEVIGQPAYHPGGYPYGGGAQPAKGGDLAPTV